MSCFKELSDSNYAESLLSEMRTQLIREGKSNATIGKYLRDARKFVSFVSGHNDEYSEILDADVLNEYRGYLLGNYKISSANSMFAGVNYLLRCSGHADLRLRACKVQRSAFREDDRDLTIDEYRRLVTVAHKEGNARLSMILQTLGSTGIRVSELPFITVESLKTKQAVVNLKGKARQVIIPRALCSRLEDYSIKEGISSGSIFVTRSGRPVDRSNILHEMKRLCNNAEVDPRKVHPHNFRHLFAISYYDKYKDICLLADILGHSNINTTRIYTTKRREELARSIENLGLIDDLTV